MAEVSLKHAKKLYATLTKMMDANKLNYEKLEEELAIRSGFNTEDFPIEFIMKVDTDKELVRFLSKLPFIIAEDRRVDVAVAVCMANSILANGSFTYDVMTGEIWFRMATTFKGEIDMTREAMEYMMMVSVGTIDNYNKKFNMVSQGTMSVREFAEKNV